MTARELATSTGLPIKAILCLQKLGIISNGQDQRRDLAVLEIICSTWGNADLLRLQLASLPKRRRESLISTCNYNRLETWVYSRYWNHTEGKLKLEAVAEELSLRFRVPVTEELKDMIHRIRRTVHNHRAYEVKRREQNGTHQTK